MSSDEIAIRVQNLSKHYQIYDAPRDRLKQFIMPRLRRWTGKGHRQYFREFHALENVSFEIKRGETVGIIGRNGSGKSTLLQIICGTLTPTHGSIETKGRIAALLELGSGFNPEFTGRENVYMNASVLGLTQKEIDDRFDDIVAFADIGDFIEQPTKTYSSGMVVRLAFAVIAHVDADILVIDEALSVGDVFFVQKCMRFLREFMDHGTVLFVSHDTGAVLNLCEKAVWLHEGHVAALGNPKTVTERYLEKLYEEQQGPKANKKATGAVQAGADTVPQDGVDKESASPDTKIPTAKKPLRDMRLDFINQTNYRNDIELFEFSPEAQSFGIGGVEITDVQLLDPTGNRLSWIVGGEDVQLVIRCKSRQVVQRPIVGFTVKDRLGQPIFVDNTYLTYADQSIPVAENDVFQATFAFTMPLIPTGDYTISVAIADGTQQAHVQHQWLHDALAFKVHASSVCMGLIGLPMERIELKKL